MGHIPRIQIVEDQYFIALDCQHCLEGSGFECTGFATNAIEAVEMAKRDRPDLILMDIRLAGEVDGIDAAITIFETLGIRCLFVSAHADSFIRRQAQLARPLGWLNKPYSHADLADAVNQAILMLGADRDRGRDLVNTPMPPVGH